VRGIQVIVPVTSTAASIPPAWPFPPPQPLVSGNTAAPPRPAFATVPGPPAPRRCAIGLFYRHLRHIDGMRGSRGGAGLAAGRLEI